MTQLGNPDNPYDLIVVGGGINGCGIARDAAMRGLSVALFEKDDLSTGATWASSGMIHGGVRYLSSDPGLTERSCRDAAYIKQIASHLIFRIPFIYPIRDNTLKNRTLLELADVYFDAYDQYARHKGGVPHSRLTPSEAYELEPGLADGVIGAVTLDEWGIDPSRLTVLNARDALNHGADIHTYSEVVDFVRDDGSGGSRRAVRGVEVDSKAGRRTVHGRLVFNATGPWAGQTAGMADTSKCQIRPGKGIHLVFAGRVSNHAIISEAIDGRQVFVTPHQNVSYVGTTDDDYWGDLDDIPILEDEIQYLLDAIRRVLPDIDRYRLIDTTVGCRPTLYEAGPYESELSRDHEIYDHADEGASNLLSIAGGKLAEYRLMCEQAVDLVCDQLKIDAECETHQTPLPGAKQAAPATEPFEQLGLSRYAASRLLYRHGGEASHILDLLESNPRWSRKIDPAEPVTEAELRWAIRHELVENLTDLTRRCRLAKGPDNGWDTAIKAAEVFCDEKGFSASDRLEVALQMQTDRWKTRRPVLQKDQLASECIGQYWFLGGGIVSPQAVPVQRDN